MAIIKEGFWLISRDLSLYEDDEIAAADNVKKELFVQETEEDYYGNHYLYRNIIAAEKIDGELNLRIYEELYYDGEFDYNYDQYDYLNGGWFYNYGSQPARTWWCDDTEVDDNFYSWWTKNAYMRANAEVDLRTIGLDPGSYSLTAQADGEGKVASPLSSTKDYTTDLEQLPTPVIEIEDGTLTITNYGEADTIIVYANDKVAKRLVYDIDFYDDSGIYFRLPRLILPEGESVFSVVAHSKHYRSSERSNVVSWAPTFYNVNFKVPDNYVRILNPTKICYGEIQNVAYRPPNPAYHSSISATNIEMQTEFLGGGGDYDHQIIGIYNATDDAEVEVVNTGIWTSVSYKASKPAGYDYGFTQGYWDSTHGGGLYATNSSRLNTVAGVKLTFTIERETDIVLIYENAGIPKASVTFSSLDEAGEINYTSAATNDPDVHYTSTTLTYKNVPPGEHYIIATSSPSSSWGSVDGALIIKSCGARYDYIEGESDYMYPITWEVSEDILPIRKRYECIVFPQSLSFSHNLSNDFDISKLECEVTGAEYTFTPREADEWYPPRFSLNLSNATGPVHVKITEREN